MRIGIDMRMAGTGEGIGRYVEELVKNLMKIDQSNQYVLIFMTGASVAGGFINEKRNFEVVYTNSKYYSWAEQLGFVSELAKLKLDLVHFPSFNAPVRYKGKFVVTIHDLIHHHYPGKKKIRLFHRLAYRLAMKNAVRKSKRIMAVSESTKRDILSHYEVVSDKVVVIYEGIADHFRKKVPEENIEKVKQKYGAKKPYILFVGAWRRYKNVNGLAQAFDLLREEYKIDVELVLVGKEDPFYPEIKNQVFAAKNKDFIIAPGFVSDEDLRALYQGASVFVLPSRFEGFGLIAVEAQTANVPVVVSDIAVLREVLGEGAVYFDPKDIRLMAEKIALVLTDNHLSRGLAEAGKLNAKKYDWKKTAEETLRVYHEAR